MRHDQPCKALTQNSGADQIRALKEEDLAENKIGEFSLVKGRSLKASRLI